MKRSTILLLMLALVTAFSVAGLAQAEHCDEGGSPHDARGGCETAENQVTCGDDGTETPAGLVWADDGGVEVCNDGSGAAPIQGRAGLSADCECIFADGDADNEAPLDGWIRLDMDGAHCSTDGQQSYNSGDGVGPEGCGP